jgi:UDP-3-O-[3-hydroxymyristoyl] glucosamine N-acyltransferase
MSSAQISPEAIFVNRESLKIGVGSYIGDGAVIDENVTVGEQSSIFAEAQIGYGSRIGNDVLIGHGTRIKDRALILDGARICPNTVKSGSRDAKTLLDGVTIGEGVLLHDEVELGVGAIIPSQRTIAFLGSFGAKNRVVTIYGSDKGPRYSVGCQIGVGLKTLRDRVAKATYSTAESAGTYEPFLGIFHKVGDTVQTAYDKEARQVEDMKNLRRIYRLDS